MTATTLAPTPTIALDLIDRPWNLRNDVGDTKELEGSIQNIGLIEPIVIRPDGNGRYILLAGFRRVAALENLGITEAPYHLVHHPEEDAETSRITLQLVENLQRVDLNPIEEASGYAQLKQYGWKQKEIARRVGRSEAHVSKRLSLLELPDEVLDLASVGRLGTEDLYELTKVVTAGADIGPIVEVLAGSDRDDTPDPHGEVEQLVKAAIAGKQADDILSARKTELEAKGIAVLDVAADRWGNAGKLPKGTVYLGNQPIYDLASDKHQPIYDLASDKHQKEPCHAVVLEYNYGRLRESGVCTDHKRHGPGGDSKLQSRHLQTANDMKKEADRLAAQRKKRNERAAKRSGALLAASKTVLKGRAPSKEKILELVADRWMRHAIDEFGVDAGVIDLLGLPEYGTEGHVDPLDLYAAADGPNRSKLLLASLLAVMLESVDGYWLDESKDETFIKLVGLLHDFGATVDIDGYVLDEESE